MVGKFTVSQYKSWQAALGPTTPKRANAEEAANARVVSGIGVHMMSDGILLRLSDDTGHAWDFHLNAAQAIALADTIPAAGIDIGWLGRDGAIIAAHDRPGRKP
jgi:hypothetical protein